MSTVLKFGGTSVEDAAAFARVAEIVGARRGAAPVVVTSAMSRFTDALVGAVRAASEGEPEAALAGLLPHLERHAAAADALLPAAGAAEVGAVLDGARQELAGLLRIVAAHPGTRRPLADEVVSFGERLSSRLLAEALRARGLPARWIDARACVRTDEEHGRAAPVGALTDECTRAELLPLLEAGEVPVLGGFIGSAASGATTTLGRGGSDYTAALVGAALGSREIQIWTDVTGFLTADPRVVAGARRIEHLSYEEAAELAYFGAKVLHPKTIQPAVERGIPVRICNSREPEAGSTLIDGLAEPSPGGVRAIAHRAGVTVLRVSSARMLGTYGFLRALFEVLARHRTSVDVVTTSEVSVSLSLERTDELESIVAELEALGEVQVEGGNAIVCVVGAGLRTTPGVAGRVFDAVADINVGLISQGASSVNLTFVVEEGQVVDAVRRLHAAFFG
ncbi:MAG TPA: lysine-sensitive aspartokinase 3 [Longimicrobiaceae bacterium]|nr:lysine-sensitive aspartokinase 3 [Longimicrobiaceae bacterium]